MKRIGIYSITNINNKKRYIGSSRNIDARWRVHKSRLRLNKHHSDHLQKSFNIDSSIFIFEVLEFIDDISQLEIREQHWIDFYKSYKSDFGYNAVKTVSQIDPQRMKERWAKPGAKEIQSRIMKMVCGSYEHRQKLSLSHLNHFRDPKNRYAKVLASPLRKRVKCIQTGEMFDSIAQAAKQLGVSVVKIRDSANKKRPSRGLAFEWITDGK